MQKENEPMITEEQKKLLQSITLTEGENAWAYVQSKSKEDHPWVAAGILSCIEKGYGLTVLEVNWATRDLRRTKSKKEIG